MSIAPGARLGSYDVHAAEGSMMHRLCVAGSLIASVAAAAGLLAQGRTTASGCDLTGYKATAGLTATNGADGLTVMWDGDRDRDVRLELAIDAGTPTIRELAIRRKGAAWTTLAANAQPEFRLVSGFRRMSNQQIQPLDGLKVSITPAIIDEHKWDAFWDAPLDLNPQVGRGGNPPPAAGIANQPGLPRKASEIARATASYHADRCEVKTDGARIEITYPGLQLGVFAGRLQFTVYRGSGLVRMEAIAKTDEPSVAYKYDAGLTKLAIDPGSRLAWRDTSNTWQSYRFGGAVNEREMPLKASNRLLIAERGATGSLAVFPPPHTFFWAREIATNLGYVWYRKDAAGSFSFGIRQAEREEAPQYDANFALYSARPGTWQHMPVYFHASADAATPALDAVLALTHGDRYKALAGYQVMNHHYHMDLGQRLLAAGSLDAEIPDLQALKSLGINIVSQIDSIVEGGGRGTARTDPLAIAKASVEGARRHSDSDFLVLPNQEYYGSPLGGHTDLLFSHPVNWTQGRAAGQPLIERLSGSDQTSGSDPVLVYHIGGADDLMEMASRENVMISMPHPRTKGSTGFPDAVKDTAAFKDAHYQGTGFRWGMGLDLSERRLCERRCLALLDDMSNWTADRPGPPKYILSISEVRYQAPGDDIYASSPVSYVKLDRVPSPEDVSPVVAVLRRGDYFVTSGEVLIPSYAVRGAGVARTIDADVEWTFPLDFVEIVWGDGKTTGRQIISTTDLPPNGTHHFSIPFNAAGQKWVRFAAWDSAGNGALVQPIKLIPSDDDQRRAR